jgi:hypothetical protein
LQHSCVTIEMQDLCKNMFIMIAGKSRRANQIFALIQ